jgi:hypothetical protein
MYTFAFSLKRVLKRLLEEEREGNGGEVAMHIPIRWK